MRTKLLYLDDSYLKEVDGTVLEVVPNGDGKYKVILDQTVFYPMGGGQPTDQGNLSDDSFNGDVNQVLLQEGEVWHFINAEKSPTVGSILHGVIDWDRRYKNMRVHSAGHIVDFALFLLGYSPDKLSPIKADHGKKSWIMYDGILEKDIKEELEKKANELVDRDLKFSWLFQPFDDLKKEAIYLQSGLPTNKPLRTLRLETVGAVADGGTQVHSTKEVGNIIIPEISIEGENTIVKYSIM